MFQTVCRFSTTKISTLCIGILKIIIMSNGQVNGLFFIQQFLLTQEKKTTEKCQKNE